MTFDHDTIQYLRELLGPKKQRPDLKATMDKWDRLARGTELEELIGIPRAVPNKRRRGGRPRIDTERRAAVLLAVIYYEYTKKRPTRVTRRNQKTKRNKYKTSNFYLFATAAFNAIDLQESESAFREAAERWERSRGFSKRKLSQLLWGKL